LREVFLLADFRNQACLILTFLASTRLVSICQFFFDKLAPRAFQFALKLHKRHFREDIAQLAFNLLSR